MQNMHSIIHEFIFARTNNETDSQNIIPMVHVWANLGMVHWSSCGAGRRLAPKLLRNDKPKLHIQGKSKTTSPVSTCKHEKHNNNDNNNNETYASYNQNRDYFSTILHCNDSLYIDL